MPLRRNRFVDSAFTIFDDGDTTKNIAFQASGITTATTRTLTVPDADLTIVGTTTTQTLTNKSMAETQITFTDITTGDASTSAHGFAPKLWAAAWQTWSPTWTNLTVGNGTVTARYGQIGKTVVAFLQIVWGTTTSASGTISFTLPVTGAAQYGTLCAIGVAFFEDSGIAGYTGILHATSTTTARAQTSLVTGTYSQDVAVSNTVPFTWGSVDKYSTTFSYEAA